MNNYSFEVLFLSLFCGIAYLLTTKFRPFFGDTFIKGVSISLLGAFVYSVCSEPIVLLMYLAFLVSSIGDVFMAMEEGKYFIQGLISFAISYSMYIFIFSTKAIKLDKLQDYKLIIISALILSVFFIYRFVSSKLGQLKTPVVVYMTIITLMAITAVCGDFGNPLIMIGALLLLSSDIVIALGVFRKDVLGKDFINLGQYYTWSSYYAGQVLIAIGFVKSFG